MRKSGFTLIELLAVIVILAIIALIAVPIVLSIIEDSKKSSQEESINMYGKAIEDAVANYLLINPNDKDITLAKIEKYINYSSREKIECTDTKIYPNGKIYLGKCSIGGTEVTYTYGEKEKTLCTLVKKNGNEDINLGDEYTCEVIKGMEEPYTFYVLGTEGTGKNQKVNLIMDRNICKDGTTDYANDQDNNFCRYAWESNNINGNGPITAMTALGNGTRNWNNVPNINLDYDDITDNTESGYTTSTYGYKGITITNGVGYITKKDGTTQTPITLTDNMPIKARLPKLKEITEAGCHVYNSTADYGTCPVWLMGYMTYYNVSSYTGSGNTDKYSMNNNNEAYQNRIYGYWLLSSFPGYSLRARNVSYDGIVNNSYANITGSNGVRAVITVSKSNLSS